MFSADKVIERARKVLGNIVELKANARPDVCRVMHQGKSCYLVELPTTTERSFICVYINIKTGEKEGVHYCKILGKVKL